MTELHLLSVLKTVPGTLKKPRIWQIALVILLALAVLAPIIVHDPLVMHDLIVSLFWAVAACSFRLIYLSGRFSAGQAAFLMVGGYTSGLVSVRLGIDPWIGLVAGGIVSAASAFALGSIVLRISGVYFMIITLGLAEIMRLLVQSLEPLTGGAMGLSRIPGYSIGGFKFGIDKVPYYYLILAIAIVALYIMYRLEHSRTGLTMRAIAQNDLLAGHVGINQAHYRVVAFVVACFFSGVAGAFFAHYIHFINGEEYGVMTSINVSLFAIIGGIGAFAGPVVGSFFSTELTRVLGAAARIQPIIYGALLLFIMVVVPGGLVSLPRLIGSQLNRMILMVRIRFGHNAKNRQIIQDKEVEKLW